MREPSSVISNYAYHKGGLEITFHNQRTYRYDCPPFVYYFMKGAISKGEYYNRRIRGQYPVHEVLLHKAVALASAAYAQRHNTSVYIPEIVFCNDVIIIGNKPYGGGAEHVAEYFTNRAYALLRR